MMATRLIKIALLLIASFSERERDRQTHRQTDRERKKFREKVEKELEYTQSINTFDC